MKETITVKAFVNDTNRSPIMTVDGKKVRSLETTLKEVIGKHLNVVTCRCGLKYGYGWMWKQNEPLPAHVKKVESDCSPAEVLPHAKNITITIEIED